MEGFVSASKTLVARPVESRCMFDHGNLWPYEFGLGSEIEVTEKQFRYMKAGFTIDEENDVYVYPGYGAFAINIDDKIKSIDELVRYRSSIKKTNPYEERVRQMQEEGYEYVLGPAAPTMNGYIPDCYGLYCKNYLEIAKKQKRKRKIK